MRTNILGARGPTVSCLGLGTSSWGVAVDEQMAEQQLKEYHIAGGNLIDTADVYALGASEQIVGNVLHRLRVRDDFVLATKAGGVMRPRLGYNASVDHLRQSLDMSLRNLRTDYVDIWQMHGWDAQIPLYETLSAMDWAVSSGRVRFTGISNYSGWQTMKAALRQSGRGRAAIVSTQMEYSLLERGIEREVVEAAADQYMGIITSASLGRGVLTGKYRLGIPPSRAASGFFRRYVGHYLNERSAKIVDAVVEAAEELRCPAAAVAIAWVISRPGVDVALVGARDVEQLSESIGACEIALPDEVRTVLDSVSSPPIGYPEKTFRGGVTNDRSRSDTGAHDA